MFSPGYLQHTSKAGDDPKAKIKGLVESINTVGAASIILLESDVKKKLTFLSLRIIGPTHLVLLDIKDLSLTSRTVLWESTVNVSLCYAYARLGLLSALVCW